MNTQSARNKTDEIVSYMIENNVDVNIITESWLDDSDQVKEGELKPNGYQLKKVCRQERSGGGIAIIHRENVQVRPVKHPQMPTSFEVLETHTTTGNQTICLLTVYRSQRPDPSCHIPMSVFFNEFRSLMYKYITSPNKLLIVGDFNIHMDEVNDLDTKNFQRILNELDLQQHVLEPTHIDGHILDLAITRNCDTLISNISVDMKISDHFIVLFNVSMQKPPPLRKLMKIRKFKAINIESFKSDLVKCIGPASVT